MSDVAHPIGADLQLGPTGDLLLVSGTEETKQRILHRLLTARGSYIWQLTYGAGLPEMVGEVASGQQIAAIITSQLALEQAVAVSPEPVVGVVASALGTVSATITYTDSGAGPGQVLSVSLGA